MTKPRLFPALLRHWRGRRGLSQLDLAVTAGVSSRHVSFMETGRAQPSREMVLRLGAALDVPMRDQNDMLVAAGFSEAFGEPSLEEDLGAVSHVIERMLAQHEPFPMLVMNRRYDVLRTNSGALALLPRIVLDPSALGERPNAFRLLFDPELAKSFVMDWEAVARALLSRLQRESLARPDDHELRSLIDELLAYPGVPQSFVEPDFSIPSEAAMAIRLKLGDRDLAFLTTVTSFSAPQNVTLEELRLESYFPLDDVTERACRENTSRASS